MKSHFQSVNSFRNLKATICCRVHPSIVQQPPPPYYPSSGMENKALDMDPAKAAVYAGQNGYGYHGANQNGGECKSYL